MKGFVYRKGKEVIQTEPGDFIRDLDSLDFPAMHLLKLDNYVVTFGRKYKPKRIVSVSPTRGCPFKCVFCCEPLINNKMRVRSPENVVDEIEKWNKELGVDHFWFSESNMTLIRPRIEGICHEILKRNLKITFEGSTSANLVDDKLLRLMKKAGLIRISYGLETGSPRIMKLIRKHVDIDDLKAAVKMSDTLDIETNVTAMIGLPGETRETAYQTINCIRNMPHVLYTTLGIANPYPGCEMYEWALTGQHGFQLMEKDFSKLSRYEYSPVRVNDLSQKDISRLQKFGLLMIHFKPRRMLAAIRIVGFSTICILFFNLLISFFKEIIDNSISLFKKRKILQRNQV